MQLLDSVVGGVRAIGDRSSAANVVLPLIALAIFTAVMVYSARVTRLRIRLRRKKLEQIQVERGSWSRRAQRAAYSDDHGLGAAYTADRANIAEALSKELQRLRAGERISAESDLAGRALSSMALPNRTAFTGLQSERLLAVHSRASAADNGTVDPLLVKSVDGIWRAVAGDSRFTARSVRQISRRRHATAKVRSPLHEYYRQLAWVVVLNSVAASVFRSPLIYSDLFTNMATLGAVGAQANASGRIVPFAGEITELYEHPMVLSALAATYEDLIATIFGDVPELLTARDRLRVLVEDWAGSWPLEERGA